MYRANKKKTIFKIIFRKHIMQNKQLKDKKLKQIYKAFQKLGLLLVFLNLDSITLCETLENLFENNENINEEESWWNWTYNNKGKIFIITSLFILITTGYLYFNNGSTPPPPMCPDVFIPSIDLITNSLLENIKDQYLLERILDIIIKFQENPLSNQEFCISLLKSFLKNKNITNIVHDQKLFEESIQLLIDEIEKSIIDLNAL